MTKESGRGAATRLRIISTAADLFHKQGVVATSPDDIIAASSTGKGQFYHYFKNKNDLVHQVPETQLAAIESNTAPITYVIDSWEDLERWFLAHIELQKRFNMTRGCPFGTIGNGVTETDELIRLDLCRIFDAMRARLIAFFIREKSQGRLVKTANEAEMAEFCLAIAQGAMLMGKMRGSSKTVEIAMREALAHLWRYATASG